jgi:hypothetical protein
VNSRKNFRQDEQDFSGFTGLGHSTIPMFHHSIIPVFVIPMFQHSIIPVFVFDRMNRIFQDLQDWGFHS